MWCMLAAPLFLGTNIAELPRAELSLVTNPELVAIDQDALGPRGAPGERSGRHPAVDAAARGRARTRSRCSTRRARRRRCRRVSRRSESPREPTRCATSMDRVTPSPTSGAVSGTAASHGIVVYKLDAQVLRPRPRPRSLRPRAVRRPVRAGCRCSPRQPAAPSGGCHRSLAACPLRLGRRLGALAWAAVGPTPSLLGVAYLAACTPLARRDSTTLEHRLPNALVLPGDRRQGCSPARGRLDGRPARHRTVPLLAGPCYAAVPARPASLGGMGMGDVELGAALGLASWTADGRRASGRVIAFLVGGSGGARSLLVRRPARSPHRLRALPAGRILALGRPRGLAGSSLA